MSKITYAPNFSGILTLLKICPDFKFGPVKDLLPKMLYWNIYVPPIVVSIVQGLIFTLNGPVV